VGRRAIETHRNRKYNWVRFVGAAVEVHQLPIVLFAAIETGTWSTEQVRSWADAVIQSVPVPASWVLDLSLARTPRAASAIVTNALDKAGITMPHDLPELLVGLLYTRLQRGELSIEEFVSEVADIIDAYEASVFDLERWNLEAARLESDDSLRRELVVLGSCASDALSTLKDDSGRIAGDPFLLGSIRG
jgi:hypothetical protein